MPKIKRLIPRSKIDITERRDWIQSKKKRPEILTLLLVKYDIPYKELCVGFKIKKEDWSIDSLEEYFKKFYFNATIEDFDYICSLMPKHRPKQILFLIMKEVSPNDVFKKGHFAEMIRTHDEACFKELHRNKFYMYNSRLSELKNMVDDILYAESFEEQKEAIIKAQNRMMKISVSIENLLDDSVREWD